MSRCSTDKATSALNKAETRILDLMTQLKASEGGVEKVFFEWIDTTQKLSDYLNSRLFDDMREHVRKRNGIN